MRRWPAFAVVLGASALLFAQTPELPITRVSPRPELSPAAHAAQVADLRARYAVPAESWPAPNLDDGVPRRELGVVGDIPHPVENPYSKEKAELGRTLFFDPRLSGSGQIACASCHDPDMGFSDGRTTAFGHDRKPLRRNAPGLLNVGLSERLFWDGRAASLEEQALAVLTNPDEMRSSPERVSAAVSGQAGYREMFAKAFPTPEVTATRVVQAIACFERTLKSGRSRFDAFARGKRDALTGEEMRGLHLFRTDARCLNCHNGPTLSDGKFHDLGLSYFGRRFEDLGRLGVTGDPADSGKFKTPSLRNLERTGPYMHNGLFELDGILNVYSAGGATLRPKGEQAKDPRFPKKSPHLKPLGLNAQDKRDLTAFLMTLTEPRLRLRPPELPGLGR